MNVRIALMLLAAMVTPGCGRQKISLDQDELNLTAPLVFPSSSDMFIGETVKLLRTAIYNQHSQIPVVFFERGYKLETGGTYSLSGSYASLAKVAIELNSQASNYHWEVTTSGLVFVYPTTGSFLTQKVGPFTANDTWFCDVIGDVSGSGVAKSSCIISGRTMSNGASVPGGVIKSPYVSDDSISVSVGESARVLDVIETVVLKAGRFDANGVKFSKNTPPRWHLNFYPAPAIQ